jgi:translation initiation factor 3 subunit G
LSFLFAVWAVGAPIDIGVYVPPKRFITTDTPGRGRGTALVVTNLPQEADELDVKILFKGFGPLLRIAVAVNPRTGRGKGWATVTFQNKADAVKAMARVDGHRYGNMILKIAWAEARDPWI